LLRSLWADLRQPRLNACVQVSCSDGLTWRQK
jgi:hypothetical protein